MSDLAGPLDGLLVVSIEQAVAAPLCTVRLADAGARVIKIERVGEGDFARHYDQAVHGQASHFVWLNRSKESIAVDVSGLGIHDSLLVGQLQLPPGVEMKANADDVIASVLVPQKEPAPDDETETLAAKAEAGRELAADKDAAAAKA